MENPNPAIGTHEPEPEQQFDMGAYVVLSYSDEERSEDDQIDALHSTIWKVRGTFVRSDADPPERKYRVDPADNVSERGVAVYDQTELVAAEDHDGIISYHKPGGGFKYIDEYDSSRAPQSPTDIDKGQTVSHNEHCPVCGCNRALYAGIEEAGMEFKQCAACGFEPQHS